MRSSFIMRDMAPKKIGRPTVFTEAFLEEILDEIAEGSTERACFRKPGRPMWRNWCKFKRNNPEFRPRLAQANEDWCAVKEDSVEVIAMDDSNDVHNYTETTVSDKNGTTIKTGATTDNTSVNRARLQIDTIKNLMKWKMPERYGDKIQTEHSGHINVQPAIELATKETK